MNGDLNPRSVRDWMIATPVVTPRTSVAGALRLLRNHGLSALPVCDKGRLVGMVHEADLLRLTPSEATTLDVYELREVLENMLVARATVPAVACCPDASAAEAASLMLRSCRGTIPVVEAGRPLGVVTWAALLRAVFGDAAYAAPGTPGRVPVGRRIRGAVPA